MWPHRTPPPPNRSQVHTFRCHPPGVRSPVPLPSPHPTSRLDPSGKPSLTAPQHPPSCCSMEPQTGGRWEFPGQSADQDEGGGGDTDTAAAPVGTRVPITGPRPRDEASRGGRGWAPGAEAAAGGDRDGAEGPSPALQAATFTGLLTEAVLGAAAGSTGRWGGRRGRGEWMTARVRRREITEVSEGFPCITLLHPCNRQPSGLEGIATPVYKQGN